jgi:c-di-GMP-binding flagellar brake protein YcgR
MRYMNHTKKTIAEDRRHFFRISDSVNLSYRFVDEQQTKQSIQATSSLLDNCSLSSALELITEESNVLHNKLEKIHSDFADYLKLLDIKIDLIAQAVLALSPNDDVAVNETRNATISVSGLGFESNEILKVGQFLEIKMLLVHSTVVIVTYAKVIHSENNPDSYSSYSYFVGVDFVNMKENDRDLLSKHVAKKQLQQIRQQKERQHHGE